MPPLGGVFAGGVVVLPVEGVVGLVGGGGVVVDPWPAPIELSPLVLVLVLPMLPSELELAA